VHILHIFLDGLPAHQQQTSSIQLMPSFFLFFVFSSTSACAPVPLYQNMSSAEHNDRPPPQPAPQPKAGQKGQPPPPPGSRPPVFLVRVDVKERKTPTSSKGDGSLLEADGVSAALELSPSVGEVTAALEQCLELALRLISVPGRIYAEPALDAYRSVAEGALQPDTATPLHLVVGGDAEYRDCAARVGSGVRLAFAAGQTYLAAFEPFVGTFLRNRAMVATVTDTFRGESADLGVLATTIGKYQGMVTEFRRIPSAADVASLCVDSRHLKLGLLPSPVQCLLALKQHLPRLMDAASKALMAEVNSLLPVVAGVPGSVGQFVKKKTVTAESVAVLPAFRKRQDRIAEMAALLANNGWPLPDQQKDDLFQVRPQRSPTV
jgi:hypothetical protein